MSFPRYPKYKASGVEWLGDVPEGWGVAPVKYVATHNDDILDETTDPETEILYVDISGVNALDGIKTKEPMLFSAAPSRARRRVKHGDTIISTVRTYLRAIAGVRNPEGNLVVSTGFAVVRPGVDQFPDYIGYVLSAACFIEQVIARSTGVGYPAINASELVRIPVALPPLPEQTAIAEFLDRETGKIDGLVAEQRRLMELLKEKRQAVISHAVTKGLNPHAPMKPSGIEWLGDVPVGWEVAKTSYFYKVAMGQTILAEDLIEHGEWPVFSATDGDHYFGRINDPIVRLNVGDIVIPARGNSIGSVKLVTEPATTTQTTIYCKPLAPGKLNANFVYQYFRGCKASLFYFTQTAIPQITVREVNSNAIVIPPFSEQTEIVAFLKTELSKFDALTAEAQRAIDLLQERRTALISAAVTGQIDVRHQPRN